MSQEPLAQPRLESIDVFRGLAIVGMVSANFLAGVGWVPPWLKHAPDAGLTGIDLVAPFFIFAIGLTYGFSARRRFARDGSTKTILHFVTRFFAILGIGALLSAGEVALQIDDTTIAWGVLQAIGVAGLVTLGVIRLPVKARLAIGLGLLALYQILLDRLWLKAVLSSPHGGLFGSISWAAMLILATALADLFHQNQHSSRNLLLASALTLLLGLASMTWFTISKNRISAPYVLVSLGISGLFFVSIEYLLRRFRWRFSLVALWGKNPLALYILHLLLLGLCVLPDVPAWYRAAPPWLTLLQLGVLLCLLTWVAWKLDRKKRYFIL